MKSKTIYLILFLFFSLTSFCQSIITITLTAPDKVEIDIKKNTVVITNTKDLDFSDGNGKLIILNSTNDVNFEVMTFNTTRDKFAYKVLANDTKTFTIAATGAITPRSGVTSEIIAGDGIRVKYKATVVKETEVLASTINNSIGASNITTQKKDDQSLFEYVEQQIEEQGYHYSDGQANMIIDKSSTIHIYIDEKGNPIYTQFPNLAKSGYDKFQFHVVTKTQGEYQFESACTFDPDPIATEVSPNAQSAGTKFIEYKSAIFGVCKSTFPFVIRKNGAVLVDRTIRLVKANRVSLGTSIIASWLKNPENIETFVMPDGQTTLIADNKDTRAFIGLFLTFHFIPRNLDVQPRYLAERVGVSVGTNINENAFDNFFTGLNFEITNGLYLNSGVHYGQVNYVVNHEDFKFGEDIFTGTLETRETWKFGYYASINIDAALFAKVFKSILSPTTPTASN
jgi:hypothetical protein